MRRGVSVLLCGKCAAVGPGEGSALPNPDAKCFCYGCGAHISARDAEYVTLGALIDRLDELVKRFEAQNKIMRAAALGLGAPPPPPRKTKRSKRRGTTD